MSHQDGSRWAGRGAEGNRRLACFWLLCATELRIKQFATPAGLLGHGPAWPVENLRSEQPGWEPRPGA